MDWWYIFKPKKIELTVENLGYQLLKRADGVG
jgi:hypothetical protein